MGLDQRGTAFVFNEIPAYILSGLLRFKHYKNYQLALLR